MTQKILKVSFHLKIILNQPSNKPGTTGHRLAHSPFSYGLLCARVSTFNDKKKLNTMNTKVLNNNLFKLPEKRIVIH